MTHACTTCHKQHDARPLRCSCGGTEFVAVTCEQRGGAYTTTVHLDRAPTVEDGERIQKIVRRKGLRLVKNG